MQPIRILHLSDVHFDASKAWDADPVLRALTKFIKEEVAGGLKPDLVAITGDLASFGKAEEYVLATRWLKEQLWPALCDDLPRERLLLVPGNHDVNRAVVGRLAKLSQRSLLDSKSQNEIANVLCNKDERQILLSRHAAYLESVNGWFERSLDLPWWERLIPIRGIRLHVSGLTSAWMSSDDLDRGQLLVGNFQLTQTVLAKRADKADWRIALMHHPWDYLAEFDCQETRATIHQHCDLLLRGHLHYPHTERILPPDPTRGCLELAAGCIYETSKYPNAFQWIELSPNGKHVRVHYRAWLHSAWNIDRNQPHCPEGYADYHLDGLALDVPTPPIVGGRTSLTSTRRLERSIVVKLPTVYDEDPLFIAAPLSPPFTAIRAALERAGTSSHLTPLYLTTGLLDKAFFQNAASCIQRARVVAAVCTPDSGSLLPAASVMYQLGLAKSIGKSIMILIADTSPLPDSLQGNDIVFYRPGEENSAAFGATLLARLDHKKLQTPNRTTDKVYEPYVICTMAPPLLLDALQWSCILDVLRFCKEIHHHFQALEASHIDSLCRLVDRLLDDPHTPYLRDRQMACLRAWNDYILHYDRVWHSDIQPMMSHNSKAITAFKVLLAEPAHTLIKESFLIENAAFFQDLFSNLVLYPATHAEIKKSIASPPYNANLIALLDDPKSTTVMAGQLTLLSTSGRSIINYADSLIRNLLSLLHGSVLVGE